VRNNGQTLNEDFDAADASVGRGAREGAPV